MYKDEYVLLNINHTWNHIYMLIILTIFLSFPPNTLFFLNKKNTYLQCSCRLTISYWGEFENSMQRTLQIWKIICGEIRHITVNTMNWGNECVLQSVSVLDLHFCPKSRPEDNAWPPGGRWPERFPASQAPLWQAPGGAPDLHTTAKHTILQFGNTDQDDFQGSWDNMWCGLTSPFGYR